MHRTYVRRRLAALAAARRRDRGAERADRRALGVGARARVGSPRAPYVVRPGDSLWSIAAARLARARSPRGHPRSSMPSTRHRSTGSTAGAWSSRIPPLTVVTAPGYGSRRHNILWHRPRCDALGAMRTTIGSSTPGPPKPARPSVDGASAAACARRYTTFERIEEVGLLVVKRDGSKEPFVREKLAGSIRKALADRPVPGDGGRHHGRPHPGQAPTARVPRSHRASSARRCSPPCGEPTRWRTCASPRSTRSSRASPTSSASSVSLQKKEPAKRRRST